MLHSLHIENIAVIKSVDIDFSSGFTVLSGETGAGKSVILDSIGLITGAKADRELIRYGEGSAMVSVLFTDISDITLEKCRELGLELDPSDGLLIQRTMTVDGRSTVRLNGRTVSLSLLRAIAPGLVSIHTQGDTGILEDPEKHIELLDIYASNGALLSEYREKYARLEHIHREIEEVKCKESEGERLKALLEYQIKDIDELKLHPGEEDELIDRKVKIKNSEKITKNSEFAYRALRGSEKGSAAYLIDRSITALTQLADFIPEYSDYADRLRDALSEIEDIAEEVYAVLDGKEADPTAVLNEIESRLDKITKLKRKYGATVEAVLRYREEIGEQYEMLNNIESVLDKLEKEEESAYSEALAIAERLHGARLLAAEDMKGKVCDILRFLDMPNIVFYAKMTEEYRLARRVLSADGFDRVEFYLSANKGADAQSLSRIASGGEMARVMLAIKSIIVDKDGVSTVIFDEVDTGVSGKTARKIGIKMRAMSEKLQIFSVTHSAQIASLADKHLLIKKDDISGTTETRVTELDRDGRIAELSRILGGINVTEAQRAAAVDMLNERD